MASITPMVSSVLLRSLSLVKMPCSGRFEVVIIFLSIKLKGKGYFLSIDEDKNQTLDSSNACHAFSKAAKSKPSCFAGVRMIFSLFNNL